MFKQWILVLLLPALLGVGGVPAATNLKAEPELLDPEIAFKFSARMKDSRTIEVRYAIAPGYYMYRERFAFELEGAVAGKPSIPRGKDKFDKTFNKTMEIYRGGVTVLVPLAQDSAGPLTLKAASQGCADAGVCYPPQTQTARLVLASAVSRASALPGMSSAASVAPGALPAAVSKPTLLPSPTTVAAGTAAEPAKRRGPKDGVFVRVASIDEVDQQIKAAGRVALLDFYADWCAPCKQMEKVTLSDKRVKAKLAQFTTLQADVTRNTLDDKLLLKRYKLIGPPGIVFFDQAGQEIAGLRVIGFEAPEKFLRTLDRALALR